MRTGTNPTCLSAALKWMRGRRIKLKGRGVQGDRRHEYKNNDGRKIIKMRGGSHRIWGQQREWWQNGRMKGKRQEKWMCCVVSQHLASYWVCVCLISVINGELSVIKNTVVKKRTKQVNVKRDERGGEETKVEERRMERRQRWRGGMVNMTQRRSSPDNSTHKQSSKHHNRTTEGNTMAHTDVFAPTPSSSGFSRPTSSDSTSSFRSLHHIVWNKYTAGFLRLTNRILPPPLCQLTPSLHPPPDLHPGSFFLHHLHKY